MTTVDIKFDQREEADLPLFIKTTAEDIEEGFGAGTCTPESYAFWTLYPITQLDAGWALLRIELEGDSLSDGEIGSAVRKVGTEPEGEIECFGQKVGRWRRLSDIPPK